jgi:hypothetical protein
VKPTGSPNTNLFDFKFINHLPISEVAKGIGLEVTDEDKIVCPHASEHRNLATPFLRVIPSNRAVCDACDTPKMSVLDMVMFAGCATEIEAADCVATFFDVPGIRKGIHLNNPTCEAEPPASKEPIALLVLSGAWSELPESVQRLIPVLLCLSKWNANASDCVLPLSYIAVGRYTGIVSPNCISKALTYLANIGWLVRLGSRPRGDSLIEDTAKYRLTPLSQSIRQLADNTASRFGEAIRDQKELRKEKRRQRIRDKMFPTLHKNQM